MKKKENYVVINGIRYDAVPETATEGCNVCVLNSKCIHFKPYMPLSLMRLCGSGHYFVKRLV